MMKHALTENERKKLNDNHDGVHHADYGVGESHLHRCLHHDYDDDKDDGQSGGFPGKG